MATLFPIHLNLEGQRVLVVGGGQVALRKVELLLDAGARITVVSPQICPDLDSIEGLDVRRRPFEPDDLDGCMIAIAATDDAEVNRKIVREAHKRRVLVNVVDQPELCDFYVPASIRRRRLCVAISTGGASPSLARRLRRELERQFPAEYGQFLDLLAEMRQTVLDRIDSEDARREVFAQISSEAMFSVLQQRGSAGAREAMLEKIEEGWPGDQ